MCTKWKKTAGLIVRGRPFTQVELVKIRRLIRAHPTWGRTRLSEEVCRAFRWYQANGRLKDRACRVALLKLESFGYLKLPPRKLDRGGRPPYCPPLGTSTLNTVVAMPKNLECRAVECRHDAGTWNALIANHHYLGLG